jgi:predicted transcriptional regulator of viral defense system
MASLETVNDFLAQHHDIVSAEDASSILREARRYAVGGLVPRGSLGFVMRGYYALFIKFEAAPAPEIPDPGTHRGVV